MKKQIMAVMLSGAMVLGSCVSVFAADAASESEAVPAAEDDMGGLGALLGSITGEEGVGSLLDSLSSEEGIGSLLDSLGSEEGVGSLLDSLGIKDGDVSGLLENLGIKDGDVSGLLENLGIKDGDISGLLENLGLGSVLDSLTGENGSLDLNAILQELGLGDLSDPEALKEKLSGLFEEGSYGETILDLLAMGGGNVEAVIESFKAEDGSYDVDQIVEALVTAKQGTNSVEINGIEITADELQKAVTGVIEFFAAMGQMETESTAA